MALTFSPAALARSSWLHPRKPRAALICAPLAIILFTHYPVAFDVIFEFSHSIRPLTDDCFVYPLLVRRTTRLVFSTVWPAKRHPFLSTGLFLGHYFPLVYMAPSANFTSN